MGTVLVLVGGGVVLAAVQAWVALVVAVYATEQVKAAVKGVCR